MPMPWEVNWVQKEKEAIAASLPAAPVETSPSKKPWEINWVDVTLKGSGSAQKQPISDSKSIGDGLTLDTVFEGLKRAESGGTHIDAKTGKLVTSPAGAEGITQLMPKTAERPGYGIKPVKDKSEGEYLRVGKEYLAAMYKKYGDWEMSLAAYNAGSGSVDAAKGKAERFGGSWKDYLPKPKETLPYIQKILGKGDKVSVKQSSPSLLKVALGLPKAIFDSVIPSAQADGGEIPYQNSFIDDAIEYGIDRHVQGLIKEGKPVPTNQKIFYETVVQGNREKLTEKDFSSEEISFISKTLKSQLAQAVSQLSGLKQEVNKRIEDLPTKKDWTKGYPERLKELKQSFDSYEKSGKVDLNLFNILSGKDLDYWDSYIMRESGVQKMKTKFGIFDYKDYADNPSDKNASENILNQRKTNDQTPKEIVHTTLGRFKAEFNPATQEFIVKDKYDFNAGGVLGGNTQPSDLDAAEGGGGSLPYRILRAYAGRKMSADKVKGRELELRIK